MEKAGGEGAVPRERCWERRAGQHVANMAFHQGFAGTSSAGKLSLGLVVRPPGVRFLRAVAVPCCAEHRGGVEKKAGSPASCSLHFCSLYGSEQTPKEMAPTITVIF